jgi:TRAP-type C4-dicarboxylate transport system permease small subunit
LGLLSIGAVIALVYAGITYIGSETWSKKSDAKDLIIRSIGALVLMFSAFIFFDQLNPELLKVRFKPIKASPDETIQINSISDI